MSPTKRGTLPIPEDTLIGKKIAPEDSFTNKKHLEIL